MAEPVVIATDEDYKYLARVLRLGPGDRLVLFDGAGAEAEAEITRVGPRAVELHVLSRRAAPPIAGPEIILLQGLARGEKLDFVVQKATELGCVRIVPLQTDHSVKPQDLSREKPWAWAGQALKGARQCRRASVPDVHAGARPSQRSSAGSRSWSSTPPSSRARCATSCCSIAPSCVSARS